MINTFLPTKKKIITDGLLLTKKQINVLVRLHIFLLITKNHFAEIEYCIGTEFQCSGFATEATKAVIKYGFENINLNKVQIITFSKQT